MKRSVTKIPPLPTGNVKFGTNNKLDLTDGAIFKGRMYSLPPTADKKTVGKTGKVTSIEMEANLINGKIQFWVRLEEANGQGWQFNYQPEE